MPTIMDTRTAMGEREPDRMWTVKEVADFLQLSIAKVQDLARSGKLRGYKIEGEWRFFKKDVYAYIESCSNQ